MYNQAWNKLLELIYFEQKDEAIGLAKLIGFELQNKNLSLQIQADIYFYFNEIPQAKQAYFQIAKNFLQIADHKKAKVIEKLLYDLDKV